MTVYIDPALHRYRGQLYCHVWADSIDELHLAAQAAGLRREWFQAPPAARWEHYDAGPAIRAALIRNGAVETDRYGAIEHLARQRGDADKLARIVALRARHAARPKAREFGHVTMRGQGWRADCWGVGPFVIEVAGRSYRFEDSDRFGPVLIDEGGEPLDQQPAERSPFWIGHRSWARQGRRLRDDGITCIWDRPPPTIVEQVGPRTFRMIEWGDEDGEILVRTPEGDVALPKGRRRITILPAASGAQDQPQSTHREVNHGKTR